MRRKKKEDEEKVMISEEENLEIVAIGVLHEGPWEKKYWSSSRGKDRYPYPVGYEAIRVQNGITYNMEIRQGLKGPLFLISPKTTPTGYATSDAHALSYASGQTPHMAFQNLLKLSSPLPRPAPNNKIHAAHFFGFRNSLVLRLLRELVSNLNHLPIPTNNDHLFAPDTLLHDDSSKDITCSPKEEELSLSTSYNNTLFDSAAQSMMSLLLPQALPLLNNPTKKIKRNLNPDTVPIDESRVEKEGNMHILMDDPSLQHINNQLDVDQATHMDPDNHSLLSHDDTVKVSSLDHDSTETSKDVNHASYMSHNDSSQRGKIIIPKSAVSLTYRRKKKKSNKLTGIGSIHHESSSCPEKHSEGNSRRTSPDYNDHEGSAVTETLLVSENCLLKSSNEKKSVAIAASAETKPYSSLADKSVLSDVVPVESQDQALDSDDRNAREIQDLPVLLEEFHFSIDKQLVRQADLQGFSSSERFLQESTKTFVIDAGETQAGSDVKPHMMDMINGKLRKFVELVGCYEHPMPISSMISCITENEIYVGVACGPLTDRAKTLFIYKIPVLGPRDGCPSFIGHASIMLLGAKGAFCGQTMPDRADLQFTPDGHGLVILNSVKASYCREGTVHCPCSVCTSARFEENAVRIVHVKFGYVSLVAKMKTDGCVLSMLVCGPNRLVAVEEGGRLHLWVMNSEWSVKTEEFFLPSSDHISPSVEELKQIPNRDHLIIGHNGFGEFILWDISKRIIMSRFSAPSKSILQFLPISLFGWRRNKSYSSNPSAAGQINSIMAATKISLSGHTENRAFLPFEEQAVGIWLLVSTLSDSDAPYNSESNFQVSPVRSWRLALLVENLVILGDALDPRASAVGASAGCGIIATCDGLVYVWELATGTKLGTLHHFKDGGVSCISTDYSRSGVLAVSGDGGHLRIYLQHERDFPN